MDSPNPDVLATEDGVILGTAAYMSPEQARGRPVDKRADIWAFGAVLYEMLTGQQAFAGEDVAATLTQVLTQDPDWTRLPAGTPVPIRRLLATMPGKRSQRVGSIRRPPLGWRSTTRSHRRPQRCSQTRRLRPGVSRGRRSPGWPGAPRSPRWSPGR